MISQQLEECIKLNKKLLPLLALSILPVLVIGMPDDADKIGKQFAIDNPGVTIGVHTLEEALTEKQEIDRAQLIVEGTILEVKPYWKIIRSDTLPRVYTEFAVKVDDVIKGNLNDKTLKVVMAGGVLDGITTKTEALELAAGNQVILLLGKDTDSIFGDAYSPISISKSIYKIEHNQATNKLDDRSGNKDQVKERISNQLN